MVCIDEQLRHRQAFTNALSSQGLSLLYTIGMVVNEDPDHILDFYPHWKAGLARVMND